MMLSHPIIQPPQPLKWVDLSRGGYPDAVQSVDWLVGGYLENRQGMYTSELFNDGRFVHLGVDIWAPAGTPVYVPHNGKIYSFRDNRNDLDYGPTIVTEHVHDGQTLYILFGHLSRTSLLPLFVGKPIEAGQILATLGESSENVGWIPHVHVQISYECPQVADMPGVCAPQHVDHFARVYPDPRTVFGPLY
jgi:murein DD-endopeptidase MepM/ murein hydrolase activator NlpD